MGKNYLDFIPKKVKNIDWKEKENGNIQLIIYKDSFIQKIIIKLFFTPDKFFVDLDDIGSFVWIYIDGNRSVYDIARLLKKEFGEEVEPIYERLIKYIVILKNNNFIEFN